MRKYDEKRIREFIASERATPLDVFLGELALLPTWLKVAGVVLIGVLMMAAASG